MRTMAGFVIFMLVVACSLQVYAIECSTTTLEKIRNCNDCIRCGGFWCIKGEQQHCSSSKNDNWCQGAGNLEELPSVPEESQAGAALSPNFFATTAAVGFQSPRITFQHKSLGTKPKVELTLINSTQRDNYEQSELTTRCDKSGACTTYVSVKPTTDFCMDDGGKYEYLNMKLSTEVGEAAVKYHVPCACACSDHVEVGAPACNGHGDFSCGVCICHRGWTGDFCDVKPKCENKRGDVQCTSPLNDLSCSGNGECGECDTCTCYQKGEGSQYFDPDNYCVDLPLFITSYCETCLRDLDFAEGRCTDCDAIITPCNETLLKERDEEDRLIWVPFKDNDNEYAAMKDLHTGLMYVMRISSCKSIFNPLQTGKVNVTVPTVLGIIAVLALVTAAAGYMVWKARSAPAPLNASQYQELDGPENSAGINPLYRPPTSSYNNPLWKGGAKV